MDTTLTLEELRQRWNDVLDLIERQDRITWMAFFDARLAAFNGKVLTLDSVSYTHLTLQTKRIV